VIFKFFRGDDAPRPPLAGRMIGWAIGLVLLSGAVAIALEVVEALIPILVPLVGLVFIYSLLLGRRPK
jgi:hypothetical protein